MLQELVRKTFNTVYAYLSEASLATAMAQKVDPEVKIHAIIKLVTSSSSLTPPILTGP